MGNKTHVIDCTPPGRCVPRLNNSSGEGGGLPGDQCWTDAREASSLATMVCQGTQAAMAGHGPAQNFLGGEAGPGGHCQRAGSEADA